VSKQTLITGCVNFANKWICLQAYLLSGDVILMENAYLEALPETCIF
jgi:hypothetical protein